MIKKLYTDAVIPSEIADQRSSSNLNTSEVVDAMNDELKDELGNRSIFSYKF